MIFYTSICANYLPKAMALAESVKARCRDATEPPRESRRLVGVSHAAMASSRCC